MGSYGLVLGGGGAKGGYEIGVWKALREMQIPICAVAGTSVGALNGAMIVQNDYEKAYKLWTSISVEHVISVEKKMAAAKAKEEGRYSLSIILNAVKEAVLNGGLDVSPLKNLLKEIINEKKIRESNIDFGMVTFSLSDFQPLILFKADIPEGKMVDYLFASACLPVFKAHQIEDKIFVDGGVYNNIPISLMIDKGIKDIIAVDISGLGIVQKVDTTGFNLVYIKNSEYLGGTLDFNPDRSKINIQLGYYDTLKRFGKLKGCQYYIMPSEHLREMKLSDWKVIFSNLGLKEEKKSRFHYRIIKERIRKVLEEYSQEGLTPHSVYMAMAEITAEQLKISRYNRYSMEDLIKAIVHKYQEIKESPDFDEYVKEFQDLLSNLKNLNFEEKVEKIITKSKFLIAYDLPDEKNGEQIKWLKQFIALTFPKIAIANAFVALLSPSSEMKNQSK